MSVDDLSTKLGGLDNSIVEYLNNTERGQANMDGLSKSINNSATSMVYATAKAKILSVALNALAGIAISLVIKGITWAVDGLIVTLDEQNKKLDDSITSYQQSKTKLECINNEVKTTSERIDELNSKQNLTFTEQEELRKLIKTNDELERKIYLLEQANKEAEKEVATEAQNTYDKYIKNRNMGAVDQIDFYSNSSLLEGVNWDDFKDDLPWLIAQHTKQENLLANAQSNGWTNIEEQAKSNLKLLEQYMSKASLDYQNLYDKIGNISDYSMTDKLKDAKQDLNGILDIVAEILGYDVQRSETSFDDIWTSKDFSQYKFELENLAKEGKLDASVLESNENYKKLLVDTGTTAEDTAQHINALVNQMEESSESEGNKSSVLLQTFTKASEGISSLATAFNELTDNEYISLETISKIKEAVGNSISNWDTYEQKLLSVKEGTAEYNQLMSELTYATLEKQLGGVNALAQADEKYIAQLLKENGVLNANAVAQDMIITAKNKSKFKTYEQKESVNSLVDALDKENLKKEEAAQILGMQANACGLSANAYMQLLAQEIAFGDNTLDVSQKIAGLNAIAKTAGIAAIAMKSATDGTTNLTGAKKLEVAEKLNIKVKDTGEKVYDKSLGKEVADWEYYYGGKWYTKFSDAEYAARQDQYITELNSKLSNVTMPDYSGSSSATQDFKESFNWIETALSRVQRAVTNFGKTVAATWQSWKVRNTALKDQMSAIRNEISLQDQAYSKYMTLAESVGLSDGYKALVREGSINIETIESESIAEAIKLYQEYYEKALAARDASADLKDELAALAQTKFSNLAQSFADLMSGNEHTISMYEATIELMEKRGYTASASLYDSLKEAESKNQDILKEKYQSLSQALDEAVSSGTVVKYSEQWYQMQNEILAVEEAIIQSNIALAEYNNALRDLEWSAFDKLHEEISEIYEETEFLDKLLSDEKKFNEDGTLTEAGQAALGLDVVNYKTHLAQAEEYAQELERIREDLAKDPYNQTLLDREDELEEKHREVLTQIEDDEQSMIDKVSEGYDTLLDHMDQMIDKRKNMLSQAKDLYDYEKNIAQQTKKITSLEKQLAAYQGDDSEEARATIQKLQVSLSEAKDNLEETEYDKYISDQEEMLDTLRLQTEEWSNARLDNEDQLLKDIVSSTSIQRLRL